MAIQVTLRGDDTDGEVSFYVLGILPDKAVIGDVKTHGNLALRGRKGYRWMYSIICMPFGLAPGGYLQDNGDYQLLTELLTMNRSLQLYAVTGTSRVDGSDDPFWDSHGLPVSVVYEGDARAAANFGGGMNYEFELQGMSVVLS